MSSYRFIAGEGPVVVSFPHVGTQLPLELRERMSEAGRLMADTDWHVDRLYGFLKTPRIAGVYSRYLVDLNRSPDGARLYPGATETELCPLKSFAGEALYQPGKEPRPEEVAERREAYWQPYHDRLARALAEARERYGIAILWEAHSMRSQLSRFFEGRLPDLSFGTADGRAAAEELLQALRGVVDEAGASAAFNGRFKGGYITRRNGRPQEGFHAVQLVISQSAYMEEEPPFAFREDRAARLRPVLQRLIDVAGDWARAQVVRRGSGAALRLGEGEG